MSVAAVYTYDRGGCSKRVSVNDILGPLTREAVDEMNGEVGEVDHWAVAVASEQRAAAQSAVWHDPETGEARGGFQAVLDLWVSASGVEYDSGCWPIGWGLCAPWVVAVPYHYRGEGKVRGRYEFTLKDGILGVATLQVTTLHQYNTLDLLFIPNLGWDKPVAGQLEDALEHAIPSKLAEKIAEKQSTSIPDGDGNPYPCLEPRDCVGAGGSASERIKGALKLARDLRWISSDDYTRLSTLMAQPSEWRCEPEEGGSRGVCQVQVRAKRLNVYPDAVELVFREGGESPLDRERVMELVARAGALLTGGSSAMCDAPTPGKMLSMEFQRQERERAY